MPGRTLTPDQIAQALTLRAAGYTVTAISDKLTVSVRSLHRVFQRHAVSKGAASTELVEAARAELLRAVTSNEAIKAEAARIVADDLAHARQLRQRMADAAEHLVATNLPEAALVMRGAAAFSTALKNTSDTLRRSLRIDKAMEHVQPEDLPELVVRMITPEEVADMRAQDTKVEEGEE
jgi:hypothetical protein